MFLVESGRGKQLPEAVSGSKRPTRRKGQKGLEATMCNAVPKKKAAQSSEKLPSVGTTKPVPMQAHW